MSKKGLVLLLLLVEGATALNNGLGLQPAMAYNSWNVFRCDVNETVIRDAALAIKARGLQAAGYKYINLDDCWMEMARNPDGKLVEDLKKFPSSLKGLGDWLHSHGFLFGIYSSAGDVTCERYPASVEHEVDDANSFASWGVDYLKYDNCGRTWRTVEDKYPLMTKALAGAGRPILYSLCEWGVNNPGAWAQDVSNSWRTTGDIEDRWQSVVDILDVNARRWRYAGPGHFNDPDMLEVGNGGMSEEEYRSHMSLWAAMKAPLIIGCDVSRVSESIIAILANRDVIAVNQDPLGAQARRIWSNKAASTPTHAITVPCSSSSMRWKVDGQDRLVNDEGNCLARGDGLADVKPCSTCETQKWEVVTMEEEKGGAVVMIRPKEVPQWALEVFHQEKVVVPDHLDAIHEGITVQIVDVKQPGNSNNIIQQWELTPDGRLVNQWQKQCLAAETDAPVGDQEVWAGPLSDGWVVILFNRGSEATTITAGWELLGLSEGQSYQVKDLWKQTTSVLIAEGDHALSAEVAPHGVVMYRLKGRRCPFAFGVYSRGGVGEKDCAK